MARTTKAMYYFGHFLFWNMIACAILHFYTLIMADLSRAHWIANLTIGILMASNALGIRMQLNDMKKRSAI